MTRKKKTNPFVARHLLAKNRKGRRILLISSTRRVAISVSLIFFWKQMLLIIGISTKRIYSSLKPKSVGVLL